MYLYIHYGKLNKNKMFFGNEKYALHLEFFTTSDGFVWTG